MEYYSAIKEERTIGVHDWMNLRDMMDEEAGC